MRELAWLALLSSVAILAIRQSDMDELEPEFQEHEVVPWGGLGGFGGNYGSASDEEDDPNMQRAFLGVDLRLSFLQFVSLTVIVMVG